MSIYDSALPARAPGITAGATGRDRRKSPTRRGHQDEGQRPPGQNCPRHIPLASSAFALRRAGGEPKEMLLMDGLPTIALDDLGASQSRGSWRQTEKEKSPPSIMVTSNMQQTTRINDVTIFPGKR